MARYLFMTTAILLGVPGASAWAQPTKEETEKLVQSIKKAGGQAVVDKNGSITKVSFAYGFVADKALVELKSLTTLRHLELSNATIHSAALEQLKDLTQLPA